MFFVGLFCLILMIPLDLFVHFYKDAGPELINQVKNLYNEYKLFFLWFIYAIITGFLWLRAIILTLYYFTPCHFIICKSLSEFLSACIKWCIDENDENTERYYIIISIFLYIAIIFFSFIYNEVIIINLWSMEVNTFKYISFREKLEFENSINNNEDNLNNRYSTETAFLSFYEDRENEEEEK